MSTFLFIPIQMRFSFSPQLYLLSPPSLSSSLFFSFPLFSLFSSPQVAVLGQLTPLLTLFIAILIKAEPTPSLSDPLSLPPLFSLPIAFVGAVILLLSPWIEAQLSEGDDSDSIGDLVKSKNYVFGIILMLFQATAFATYLVYYRRWLFRMGPVPVGELELELSEYVDDKEGERKEGALDPMPREPIAEISRDTMTPSLVPIGVCRRWKDYPVTAVTYFTLGAGIFLLIPLSLQYWIDPTSIQNTQWESITIPLFYAVVMTGFLYCCNSVGLKYLPSSVISAFLPLGVLFTITLSKLTLDESLSRVQIAGMSLIISGVGSMIVTGLWKEYRHHYEREGERGR